MTREQIALALQRAVAALRAHDPATARRELLPLETIIRVAGALRLIKEGRHRAARDMIVNLLPDWLPPVPPWEGRNVSAS